MTYERNEGEEVERQLEEWTRRLDDYQTQITAWKIQANKLNAEARASTLGKIRHVEEKIQALKDRIEGARVGHAEAQRTRAEALNEVKAGATQAWASLKTGVEQAWTELKSTLDQTPSNRK